ncbi:mitochondrial ribosomal protein S25-domain-containing protein [Mycena vulgaris]|nr:mitochondrial ribosomal protein S25-domain-containing protein [Mycena vulgaris]
MGRRIASQVHHQVSRLMRGNIIKEQPLWYQPVLDFPPLPLPPKAPPARTSYDQKMTPMQGKLRRPKNQPLPIYYIEDDIRRQFYSDHPFEAFRPTTLVEKGDIQLHAVSGEVWTRLRQRGRNPNAEDAIQFTLNLHQKHKVPLSQAYARAVAQFRALRSEHHIATSFAVMEAEELGGTFVRGEIEHAFEKEKRAVATWEQLEELDEGQLIARKRWKMIAERHEGETHWSKGVEYVRMWRAGIRVNYSPAMTDPVESDDEDAAEAHDHELRMEERRRLAQDDSGDQSEILTTEEFDGLTKEYFEDGEEYEEEDEDEDRDHEEANAEDNGQDVEEDAPIEDHTKGSDSEFFDFTKKF